MEIFFCCCNVLLLLFFCIIKINCQTVTWKFFFWELKGTNTKGKLFPVWYLNFILSLVVFFFGECCLWYCTMKDANRQLFRQTNPASTSFPVGKGSMLSNEAWTLNGTQQTTKWLEVFLLLLLCCISFISLFINVDVNIVNFTMCVCVWICLQ